MATYGPLTNGDLLFSNITALEVDIGSVFPFVGSTASLDPYNSPPFAGFQFGGFNSGIFGVASASINVTFNYDVDELFSGNAITGVQSLFIADLFSGPGIHATATENVFDTSNNLVAQLNWDAANPLGNQPVTLPMGYQHLHVTLNLTVATDASATASSLVFISTIGQGFDETPTTALAGLGDFVWQDTNADGLQDNGELGVQGVTVELLNSSGNSVLATTTTDSSGFYSFTNLLPGTYEVEFVAPTGDVFTTQGVGGNPAIDSNPNTSTGITGPVALTAGEFDDTIDAGLVSTGNNQGPPAALGDFVWLDTNKNGIQDSGEQGVSGVTVELLTGNGASVLATTTTDSNGLYSFTNLTPGSYEVEFVAPTGDAFTLQTQGGNTAVDSNPDVNTGITGPVTLTAGQTDNTIDAGIYLKPAALGDFVWLDTNRNGIQDSGENGIQGVTVELLNGAGSSVLATTTTDSSGLYHFTNLAPGNYEVEFFAPTGDAFSPQLQGSDTSVDSNPDTGTGITGPVTLTAGQTDNTIDAGLYVKPAALGDYVWLDTNKNGIQDSGESGVKGVTVELLNGNGSSVLATTTTDASGLYHFTNLAPGSYEVEFFAPTGDAFTLQTQGLNTAVDSNPNVNTGITGPVTLTAGQTDNTIDAGLYVKVVNNPGVMIQKLVSVDGGCTWQDANTPTGPTLLQGCGNTAQFKFIVTNTGNVTLTNLTLHDLNDITHNAVDLNGAASGNDIIIASLAVGASYTTKITLPWVAGQNTDTGTVTGSYNGTPLSDDDDANYFGATPGIKIDKQISFDGSTWYDVGVGTLDAPILQVGTSSGGSYGGGGSSCGGWGYSCGSGYSCSSGSTVSVYYRVIVTNTSTGGVSEKNVDVSDNTGLNFTFGSGHSQTTTLAAGQSVTSNVVSDSAATGTHTDTATATGTATDSAGNTAGVSASDIAQYTGLGKFVEGSNGQSSSYWSSHCSSWDGAATCSGTDVLYDLANHGKSGPGGSVGVLLGDANHNGVTDNGESTLFIPLKAAQELVSSSASTTDVRQVLLKQALSAQLNVDNGDDAPGWMPGNAVVGTDLISDAVKWLTGKSPFIYPDGSSGNVDTNHDGAISAGSSNSGVEFNTTSGLFTSSAVASSKNAWNTVESLGLSPTDFKISGLDLKNALQAFNQNQLVTSSDGMQIGWNSGGTISDIHLNNPVGMWTVLKDAGVVHG